MSFDVQLNTKLRLAFDPKMLAGLGNAIVRASQLADKDDCLTLVISAWADPDEGPDSVITVESLNRGKQLVRYNSHK